MINIYAGPYLHCLNTKGNTSQKKPTCSNTLCKNHGMYHCGNFCSNCGSPVATINTPVEDYSVSCNHKYDITEKIDETLSFLHADEEIFPDVDIWLPNCGQIGKFYEDDRDENLVITDFSDFTRNKDIQQFSYIFRKEIAIITPVYNALTTKTINKNSCSVYVNWAVFSFNK